MDRIRADVVYALDQVRRAARATPVDRDALDRAMDALQRLEAALDEPYVDDVVDAELAE